MQDFSWESIWAGIQAENIQTQATINVNKEVLFDILKKNNVESVFVSFDGSGDSGGFDTVELTPETTQPLLEETAIGFSWSSRHFPVPRESDPSLKDAIEIICYDILHIKHLGWETNEGSYGTFEFDVEKRKIRLEFKERTVSEYNHEI